MKFAVQHLKYGARFWIPHCKDTLQKLVIVQRIPNGKMPCLIVISWKKWDRKPRKENTSMLHGYFSKYSKYPSKYLESCCVEEGLALSIILEGKT